MLSDNLASGTYELMAFSIKDEYDNYVSYDSNIFNSSEPNYYGIPTDLLDNVNTQFVIQNDDNKAPTSIILDASSVTENDVGGHVANISSVDPDGDSLIYSVLSSHDGDMLEVDGTTIKFKTGVSADYEQDQNLQFILRATDPDDLYVDQEFNLNVLDDVSDNPKVTNINQDLYDNLIVGTSSSDVLEGTSARDLIIPGDQDDSIYGRGGDDIIFIADGKNWIEGNEGNDYFIVDQKYGLAGDDQSVTGYFGAQLIDLTPGEDTLVVLSDIDISYSPVIYGSDIQSEDVWRVQDRIASDFGSENVIVFYRDPVVLEEYPVDISYLYFHTPDDVNLHGSFVQLQYTTSPPPADTIKVLSNINDIANQSPYITSSEIVEVSNNISLDTVIYDLNAIDPDGDKITYGMSIHYNHLFSIDPDNGELRFIEAPTQSVYEGVILFASDGISLDDTIQLTINVVDENEAPTSITLDTSSVIENDVGGHIANIAGVDPDGDSLTYNICQD